MCKTWCGKRPQTYFWEDLHMKKNKVLLGATAMTLTLLLAACGGKSSSSSSKTSIRVMSSDIINTMDPGLATDVISGQAMTNTYAGLYRFEGKSLKPDMAKSMATVSKDKKTYTFHLRKNAKWSDGKEVTAQDFAYAWKRAIDPKTKSEYAYIFSGIENADAIIAGKKDPSTLGVKAINKTTFQVKLDKVMPYFEKMIALQTFDPIEKSNVTKWGAKYGTSAKTLTFNGPYTMKKWQGSDNKWTQTKNPKYWNAKNVKVQTLKYQVVKDPSTALNLYQDNKLDDVVISGNNAQQMQNDPAYTSITKAATYYLEMNGNSNPIFKNLKIRQAMSLAVNRKEFIKKVLGNGSQPISTVVPSKMFYSADGKDFTTEADKAVGSETTYNLKKAQKLFAEGMKEIGKTSASFSLMSDDTEAAKNTLEYLQNALQKVSSSDAKLTVNTKSVPFKTRLALSASRDFDMVVTAWSADFPDAISFLDLFNTGAAYNDGEWSNKTYDAAVAASKGSDATSDTKRWNDLQTAAQTLTKDMGVVPLYQLGESHLIRTSVKGMQSCPNGMVNFVGATNNK